MFMILLLSGKVKFCTTKLETTQLYWIWYRESPLISLCLHACCCFYIFSSQRLIPRDPLGMQLLLGRKFSVGKKWLHYSQMQSTLDSKIGRRVLQSIRLKLWCKGNCRKSFCNRNATRLKSYRRSDFSLIWQTHLTQIWALSFLRK